MHNLFCHCSISLKNQLSVVSGMLSADLQQPATNAKNKTPKLLACEGRLGCAFQNAQSFFFTHDQEVFAIDLDFRAGILAEQNTIASLHGQREGLALLVRLASADGNH